ncbi:unnamed protein product [Fraxinus pennsylvanica]|uniref:Homeobox domain-containing protein n=1 Tax=Fraxinus pennsylvanica TaxID=56036 RepID=A0AAD1YRL0_9LAMI|nr:unnamed protein product [Fraxinus pennsylvanica]
MWMMGYNYRGEFNSIQSPFNGRKLRPIFPRPASAAAINLINRDTDLLVLNHHHLAAMAEQNKREFNTQQIVVSSRWNPTPEQLQTLEELYRRGIRTPSAEQIQLITSQLRRYGKIEGKNVFYWFQNHKARERQKRRRRYKSISHEQPHNNGKRKESGANTTIFEVEQPKNWASPTNSSTIAEAEKAANAECKADGWLQFEETELQQRRNLVERKNRLQMMNLSGSSSHTKLINSTHTQMDQNRMKFQDFNISNHKIPWRKSVVHEHEPYKLINSTHTAMDPNRMKFQDFNISNHKIPWRNSVVHEREPCSVQCSDNCRESETLLLFPLRSCHENEGAFDNDIEVSAAAISSDFGAQYQFFEFLPLKN